MLPRQVRRAELGSSLISHCSYEDCDHQIVDIPYFDTEQTCEEVEYDECREVKIF